MADLLKRVILMWIILGSIIGAAYLDAQSPLFLSAPIPDESSPVPDPRAIRSRYVTVDVDQIGNPDIVGTANRTLLLNLFPDASYEAVLDRVDRIGRSVVWVGHVSNSNSSSVTLSVESRTVYGRIVVGRDVYIVRLLKDDVHVIVQMDPAAFPGEKAPIAK
jgi:hypothetical protein